MQVVSTSPNNIYHGITHAISRISTLEGSRSLWKGMSSVILGAGPAHAVYFGTYEAVKSSLGGNSEHVNLTATAVAGASATIVSDALMNPFDVIKQRMQLAEPKYPNILVAARNIYTKEGVRAFFISYPTTLSMTVPFQAIQFSTYEFVSKLLNRSKKYDPLTHVVSGGIAGALAAAATTPLDVIKTMLQTKGNSQDAEIKKVRGFMDAAKIIYNREGMTGFSRGMRPRLVAAMPSTAVCWMCYELGICFLFCFFVLFFCFVFFLLVLTGKRQRNMAKRNIDST